MINPESNRVKEKPIKVLAFPAYTNKYSNPYNALLYDALTAEGVEVEEYSFLNALCLKYDLIHVHWPEVFANSKYRVKAFIFTVVFVLLLFWAKLFRKKLVWTVHNLKPHNIKYPLLNKLYWPIYMWLVDAYLSLSLANKKIFLAENKNFTKKISAVTYHGLYDSWYKNTISSAEARASLSLDANKKVCLFLGQLKPYKNIELLIGIFKEQSVKNTVLLIAGRFESQSYKMEIEGLVDAVENITIIDGFVEDDEMQCYCNAADLMVLPFKNIFNSGSALMSASFELPVLVPFGENFSEYSKLLPGLIHTYEGELSAKEINNATQLTADYAPSADDQLSWASVAKKTKGLFEEVVGRG